MNIKDKYEISKQKLKNLEKRGLIKKESIKYEEENGTFVFEYNISGKAQGILILKEIEHKL